MYICVNMYVCIYTLYTHMYISTSNKIRILLRKKGRVKLSRHLKVPCMNKKIFKNCIVSFKRQCVILFYRI